MMKIVPKRRWVVLLGAAFLVASCDSGPFYDNSYCRLEGDQNKLFCQMGKRMPFVRSGDEVQLIDLCQQVSHDSGILLTKLFQNVDHEGRHLAAGGYCLVRDVLEFSAQD